jgi:hypothetical protein
MNDELQRLWTSDPSPRLSKEEKERIMQQAEAKLEKFDRRLQGRQYREILGAVLVAALFGVQYANATAVFAKVGCAVIIAGALWIVYYLLRHGLGPASPYPGASLEEYKAGVVSKYNHQIRLLSRVKYWYVLPLYVGIVLVTVGGIERNGWVARPFHWYYLAAVTVLCAVVVWLNEVWTVKRLRKERDELSATLS